MTSKQKWLDGALIVSLPDLHHWTIDITCNNFHWTIVPLNNCSFRNQTRDLDSNTNY